MSENEFDIQRDRAEEDRENVVLTGEEIELPGEDSDASAIIGESSEPIHTGEIEAVAIGGLTGRVPAAAPLKPTIEDKISTGELPVVTASEGDLPIVSPTDEAEDTAEVSSDDSADAVSEEVADQQEEPAEDNAPANEEPASEQVDEENASSQDAAPEAEQTEDASDEVETVDDPEPTLAPVMTPAQAAAAMGLSTDDAAEKAEEGAEADDSTDEPATDEANAAHEAEESAVGGAAAEHTLTSRRSMIFGDDDDATSPSIPALTPVEQDETVSSDEAEDPFAELDLPTEEATPFTEPTTQLPTQDAQASYSFEDQDAADEARPRRRSLLGEGDNDSEAATLAAIASTAARGDKSESPRLDDELFSAAPEVTEMPSRTGAHWLSFLLFLLLVPAGWYLAADAGARMTLADAAPMYTGVASIVALGELLGATLISAILFVTARRSSLGAWLMGLVTLVVGLPWVMAPGITAASALTALTALTNTGSLGANLSHHLQASGYSGRFALLGIALLGLAYVSHSARRTGREEEALRTSIEAINPAGAFYSKRARKKAAKDAARK
ncbi:hypothetical protein QP500_05250 [Pauljensenia sp. UMB0018B]|uniref:Uncharacterized protein n=1 Tax=Schaalia odontolytica TaxID=1660 RepID=A0A2I1HZS0_9ACTO|nr:hypothetical protein [Schaalia odontolytica]MDK7339865.1 hypothetical protein [Pauljensenia sp. UMB0018B]PKY64380.1 hypothetical protein CYJ22_06110 [Schaalia odontolytica]